PSSVGTVEPGPDGAMLIEPAWLDDAGDREAMVAAARLVASWLGDPAVAAVAEGVMLDDQGSDLSAIEGRSDVELGRWLVAHPGPVRHPTSTMSSLLAPGGPGADDDPGYARGLLVADGSVLPTVPTVDPQLPIMANAWRLAGRLAET
ncbi:MAG: GMC oxidoreductase, partial [Actinomycetota bacterium]